MNIYNHVKYVNIYLILYKFIILFFTLWFDLYWEFYSCININIIIFLFLKKREVMSQERLKAKSTASFVIIIKLKNKLLHL